MGKLKVAMQTTLTDARSVREKGNKTHYKGLLQHATGIGASNQKAKVKANH